MAAAPESNKPLRRSNIHTELTRAVARALIDQPLDAKVDQPQKLGKKLTDPKKLVQKMTDRKTLVQVFQVKVAGSSPREVKIN